MSAYDEFIVFLFLIILTSSSIVFAIHRILNLILYILTTSLIVESGPIPYVFVVV